MIFGHGDDQFSYTGIKGNFSSNCYYAADHSPLIQHLQERLGELMGSYPEPDGNSLVKLISEKLNLPQNLSIAVFNGATEAIYSISRLFAGKQSYIAGPTFSEYESALIQAGCPVKRIDLRTLIEGYESEFEPESHVWICNPNNPDGRVFPKASLCSMFSRNPKTHFIVDQSYADFTDLPVLYPEDIAENVTLVCSLTKQYAIPGLRLGYLIGDKKLLSRLEAFRMPWAVNAIALEAGKYLLSQPIDFMLIRKNLFEARDRMMKAFSDTGKIEVFPSDTHYFLCRLIEGNASELKEHLALQHGLLIRNAENFAPHYNGYFRIAVQSTEMNDLLINAITHYVSTI